MLHLILKCRHTEDSHVKTNIVHTLFRVRKYGLMSLDQFRDILSPGDFKRCKKSQKKTWYSLPLNVFTNFTFQVISSLLSSFFVVHGILCFYKIASICFYNPVLNIMSNSSSFSYDIFFSSLCAA